MQVRIRPFSMEDVPEVARLLGQGPEISVRTATIPFPYTEEDARKFISKVVETGDRAFAVTVDERLVGGAGIIGTGDEVEIGYWIGQEHWGNGYATAAVAELVEIARKAGSTRLIAWVFPDNLASARVLEKSGFRYEGEFDRDLPLRGGLRWLNRFGRSLKE